MSLAFTNTAVSDFFHWVQPSEGSVSLPHLVLFSSDIGFSLRFQGSCLLRGVPFGWQLADGVLPALRTQGDIHLLDLDCLEEPLSELWFQDSNSRLKYVWIGTNCELDSEILQNESSLAYFSKSLGTDYIVEKTVEIANKPKRRFAS